MPSWNIHTAHVERLLREEGADKLGIHDINAFLFGNFVPDIYVGYMVPNISYRIDYKMTHLALREHIPLPDYNAFWDFYIVGGPKPVTDLTLGVWAHLVADHTYNKHTRAYIASIGLKPGESVRISKQGDFALFGRTKSIAMVPEVTDSLIDQCRHFPQYSIAQHDLRGAVEAAKHVVEVNKACHLDEQPSYTLLTPEFFEVASEEANKIIVEGLESLK